MRVSETLPLPPPHTHLPKTPAYRVNVTIRIDRIEITETISKHFPRQERRKTQTEIEIETAIETMTIKSNKEINKLPDPEQITKIHDNK